MFTLQKLDYPYNALEPYIDEETMRVHHSKHHQAYIDNLNEALKKESHLQKYNIESILINSTKLPQEIKQKIINNGGGVANHNLFWKTISPNKSTPSGNFLMAIKNSFGNMDTFKEKLSETSLKHFGSGWGWLVINSDKLEISSTQNQDSPLSNRNIPLLGIDVWEHAYYLKYQNRRVEYIKAIWNIINWGYVSELFDKK